MADPLPHDNRRAEQRHKTRIDAVVRLIENEPPHGVVAQCKGVIIDAAYGGLKVVIPSQPPDVMTKLQTGDYRVIVEASRSPTEKAEIVGHSRWSEVRGNNVVLGLRCPTMEPGQIFILGWVHGEAEKTKTSSQTPHWIAIAVLACVSVIQTLRISDPQTLRDMSQDATEESPKHSARVEPSPSTGHIQNTTAVAPVPAPPAVTSQGPEVREYGVIRRLRKQGKDISGLIVAEGQEHLIVDVQITQNGAAIEGCDISGVDIGGTHETPFKCTPLVAPLENVPFDFRISNIR